MVMPHPIPIMAERKTGVIPKSAARRSFVRSVIGSPPPTQEMDAPDMEHLKKVNPELGKAFEMLYFIVDGMAEDINFLMKEAPTHRCGITTEISILLASLQDRVDRQDKQKVKLPFIERLFGKKVYIRLTTVIVITSTVGKIWWPEIAFLGSTLLSIL